MRYWRILANILQSNRRRAGNIEFMFLFYGLSSYSYACAMYTFINTKYTLYAAYREWKHMIQNGR
jgi:hypothetical protein